MLASEESLAWPWEKKLAFVGADNPAFESLPFNKTIGGAPRSLHQVLLGVGPVELSNPLLLLLFGYVRMLMVANPGRGQSIVEFLDLEALAETLHPLGRSTFFLTLQNLNTISGIASPPNALAICEGAKGSKKLGGGGE